MTRRSGWGFAVILGAVLCVVGVLVVSYLRRIGPQFPSVEGTPFTVELLANGCPEIPEWAPFVDTPGEFVPPDPLDIVLCTTPSAHSDPPPTEALPEQRVLLTDAAGFAALLNRMPDRNHWFRDWQRKYSGFWPDRPPEFACSLMGRAYDFSFVLRYEDRAPVPLISNCTGWTDGVRTRIDPATRGGEHIVDEFIRRFDAQAASPGNTE